MGYYYTVEPENAVPPKFCASPKTHVPGPPVKERGYRYYSAENGRWVNRDPIGEKGGGNLYRILRNSVVNKTDKYGLLDWQRRDDKYLYVIPPITYEDIGETFTFESDDFGVTTTDIVISGECVRCGLFDWRLGPSGVTLKYRNIIRVNNEYVSNSALYNAIIDGELQHVADMDAWADGPGKASAIAAEIVAWGMRWWFPWTCKGGVKSIIEDAIKPGLISANNLSHDTYDYPDGPHELDISDY